MARSFLQASSEFIEVDSAVVTNTPLSMACWFYVPAGSMSTNGAMVWVGDKDAANHYFYLQAQAAGELSAGTRAGGGAVLALSTTTWTNDTWHHAAGVWASSTSRSVLLDGGGKGTNGGSATPTDADRTAIGALRDSSPTTYFGGQLAEVAIWDASLTDTEVAILAMGYSPLFVRPGNLVLYKPLIRNINTPGIGPAMTATGTSVVQHSRVIYPATSLMGLTQAAPGGGGAGGDGIFGSSIIKPARFAA